MSSERQTVSFASFSAERKVGFQPRLEVIFYNPMFQNLIGVLWGGDNNGNFIKLWYDHANDSVLSDKALVQMTAMSRIHSCENKKWAWSHQDTKNTSGGFFASLPLTVIICVEFGFELLHLPLISQQQRSVFLQRPHPVLLLVLCHLLDEGVLLIVGDSWKGRKLAGGIFFKKRRRRLKPAR